MTTLVFVHGTNGSGKSTLARMVIAAAGGVTRYERLADPETGGTSRAGYTLTAQGVALVGPYRAACGGVDPIHPYRLVTTSMAAAVQASPQGAVFAEGLMSPGFATCLGFKALFDRFVVLHLELDLRQCVQNMLSRRRRMGKGDEPYDPYKLERKASQIRTWARNTAKKGIEIRQVNFGQAHTQTFELLGLKTPSVEFLLGD